MAAATEVVPTGQVVKIRLPERAAAAHPMYAPTQLTSPLGCSSQPVAVAPPTSSTATMQIPPAPKSKPARQPPPPPEAQEDKAGSAQSASENQAGSVSAEMADQSSPAKE